jgi:amidase
MPRESQPSCGLNLPNRRTFLAAGVASGLLTAATSTNAQTDRTDDRSRAPVGTSSFELSELSITDLKQGLKSGKFTARSLVEKYLAQIDAVDKHGPKLASVIEVNPDALDLADALDQERKSSGTRGPLHGIPLLIKDNIDTADKMATTCGSLALVGSKPPEDAFLVQQLRKAGAVILGKTNLSEWANARSKNSTSGWSGRGGLTRNPYVLDRNPSGSSSGSAAAVSSSLAAGAIGTETDGSVVCPSSVCGIVGIKPTVGLVSRTGIIPSTFSQDSAGPMARTVRDAAILLSVLAAVDPQDTTTSDSNRRALDDYTTVLDESGLKGTKIGVARNYFGFHDGVDAMLNTALEAMKKCGATLIDTAALSIVDGTDAAETTVSNYELKSALATYLARLGPTAPVKTLKDVIDFNDRNRATELQYFGQDQFLASQEKGPLTEYEYLEALAKCRRLTRTEGIDAVMAKHQLDALVAPTSGPACMTDLVNGDHWLGGSSSPAAIAGYPSITLPAGAIFGLPVGLSFFGRAWSEPTLLKIAYAFEQATKFRQPPKFLPTIDFQT